MDARQAEFLRKRIADAARTEPRWLVLRERLLSIGGKEIVVGFGEYFSDGISPSALTKRARLFDARGVLKVTGAGGECHHNTAALCAGEQLWRFLRRRDLHDHLPAGASVSHAGERALQPLVGEGEGARDPRAQSALPTERIRDGLMG